MYEEKALRIKPQREARRRGQSPGTKKSHWVKPRVEVPWGRDSKLANLWVRFAFWGEALEVA
jgi:hypothetical protein